MEFINYFLGVNYKIVKNVWRILLLCLLCMHTFIACDVRISAFILGLVVFSKLRM